MRALNDTQAHDSPRLAWVVALLAAAAVMLVPATALGEEEAVIACDPVNEECATTAVVEEPATGVSGEPAVAEQTAPPVQETPVAEQPTPTPRIAPASPEPALIIEEPADLPPVAVAEAPAPAPSPAAPAAPDTPDPAAAPLTAKRSAPAVAPKPDVAPSIPATPDAKPFADAVPAALLAEVSGASSEKAAVAASKRPLFDIGAFTKAPESAGRFVDGLAPAVDASGGESAALAAQAGLTVEEIFTSTAELIRPAVAEPRNLLEVLATYLVPGEGGSYTATLAALIQLAFVLVVWGLLRPRLVTSPLAEVRDSRAVGYRAVVFRPG
jgi:hypothetical protein